MGTFYAPQNHFYYNPVAAPPPPQRQYASHGTSSAFSPSANPDEDWTKISDLAERRRIQNRIAQRNYRKKLKKRMEDLERRAGSPGDEGEQDHQSPGSNDSTSDKSASSIGGGSSTTTTTTTSSTSKSNSTKRSSSKSSSKSRLQQQHQPVRPTKFDPAAVSAAASPSAAQSLYYTSPAPQASDDFLFPPASYSDSARSLTPPMFSYATFPPVSSDALMLNSYTCGAAPAYPAVAPSEGYPSYMAVSASDSAAMGMGLSSVSHFSDAVKREVYPSDSGDLGAYMPYLVMPSFEVDMPSPYESKSQKHTPPLSHSFDHSANCSESGQEVEYPQTPLSSRSPSVSRQMESDVSGFSNSPSLSRLLEVDDGDLF